MTDNEWDEYAGGWDTNRSTTVYANCAFAELLKITELAALSVFDFGCGTGLLSERMSPEISHIVALDSSAKMIERLKQKALPNVFPIAEFLTGDLIRRNSLMHQKFDLITASSVCAFLPDYKADLSLLRSILKPKPTIAAIAAPARAAGMTLAISCDMVIAADDVDFSYPEVAVGVIPAMHFVHLPRQIGRHKAFELLFTGDTITAPEAERRGLVNYAVPRAQVLDKAREFGAKFAAMSPVATQLGRDAFMRANDFEYRRAIENTVETICNIISTGDSQEGLNAFNEKRPPNW